MSLVGSAAYRIASACSAAFALTILLLGTSVYFAADHEFRSQRDRGISEEAQRVASLSDLPTIARDVALRSRVRGPDAFLYALFDPGGRRVAGLLDAAAPQPGLGHIVFRDGRDPVDVARTVTMPLTRGYKLTVGIDDEPIERINRTILVLFAIAFAVVLAVGAAGALLLGAYLARRLASISGTAEAIMGGDLGRRVTIGPRGDEFDEVGRALNAMLDRIGRLMDSLRHVSSDVAHDLRTPLVRLRAQLALIGEEDGAVERALEQGDALLSLFGAILRIAEVEGGGAPLRAVVDLSALAVEIAETYEPALADVGRTLTWEVEPGAIIVGDRELLIQVLVNLLDNVRVHTPPGTTTRVDLTRSAELVRLDIVDNGPGVREADRSRIFERFARGEDSRNTPGAGLGLSLVRAVVRAHGGEVRVADAAPGLRVVVLLPVPIGEIATPVRSRTGDDQLAP